jgi:hypothetical protein
MTRTKNKYLKISTIYGSNREIKTTQYEEVKVVVQHYSMVKLRRAEPGDTRNIIMWTEGKGKNSRRKEM